MPTLTKSGNTHELEYPSDQDILDAFDHIRNGETLRIICRSAAQWHDTGIIVKDEFPNTLFRITKKTENSDMILIIKVL
jgi:hypothetical protein